MTHAHSDAGGQGNRRMEATIDDEREDHNLDREAALPNEEWETWPSAVVSTVAAEVSRRRSELGLTQHELAEQCAELGYAIPRNVLANLESGRRQSLLVVELLVLAKALDAAPVTLLFPVGHSRWVHPLPGSATTALAAADWFSGLEFGNEDTDLSIYRSYEKARRRLSELDSSLRELKESGRSRELPEGQEAVEHQVAGIEEARLQVRAQMSAISESLQEDGLLPPEPNRMTAFDQTDIGPNPPEENT